MDLILHKFDLPCRHPFTIARGTTTVQRTLIVELRHAGHSGYGEAVESRFYGATVENMTGLLESLRRQVEAFSPADPAEFWEAMQPGTTTFPHAALDAAACDLWGKLLAAPLWRLWGLDLDRCPPSNYTIGLDSIQVMVEKLKEFDGWPVYKIKLGTSGDIQIIRRLREHTAATFRVDANCAWGVDETIRNAASLEPLGVEFIEQPLPADDWSGMKQVHRQCVLPVIADESCRVESDVDQCAECFDGINIKLVKCGGPTPARRMIARARQLGLKVMIGCFTESSVGISAAAQLLPLVDYADLDGALLLARDVAAGVGIHRGRVIFPDRNGCGVRLLWP